MRRPAVRRASTRVMPTTPASSRRFISVRRASPRGIRPPRCPATRSGERQERPLAFPEADDIPVAGAAQEGQRTLEAPPHLPGSVGVRAQGDRYLPFPAQAQEILPGVDLPHGLAQARRAHLHHQAALRHPVQAFLVEAAHVAPRPPPEFLDEVGVGQDVEQAAFRGVSQNLEIPLPEGVDVPPAVSVHVSGVVETPAVKVVHGTEHVVEGIGPQQFRQAVDVTVHVIHLDAHPHGQPRGALRQFADLPHVLRQLLQGHAQGWVAQVQEGEVVGEAYLRKAELQRTRDVILRPALGVAAAGGVQVVIHQAYERFPRLHRQEHSRCRPRGMRKGTAEAPAFRAGAFRSGARPGPGLPACGNAGNAAVRRDKGPRAARTPSTLTSEYAAPSRLCRAVPTMPRRSGKLYRFGGRFPG